MPIHDWKCPLCNHEERDRYQSRIDSTSPCCPLHGSEIIEMQRMWTTNRMHRSFEAFDFESDAGEKIRIDSMSKLREVERLSERNYREGTGRPFIFRQYAQDNSNMDKNVFGQNDHPKIEDRNGRANRISIRRRGTL